MGENFPGQVTPGQGNFSFGDNFTQGLNSNQPIQHVTASGQPAPDWPTTVDYVWRPNNLKLDATPPINDATEIIYNGSPITFNEAQPVILNGELMVPIRGFAESIGGSVMWDNDNQEILLNIPNHPALALTSSRGSMTDTVAVQMDEGVMSRAERFSNRDLNYKGGGQAFFIGDRAYMAITDLATVINGATDWQPGNTTAKLTSSDP